MPALLTVSPNRAAQIKQRSDLVSSVKTAALTALAATKAHPLHGATLSYFMVVRAGSPFVGFSDHQLTSVIEAFSAADQPAVLRDTTFAEAENTAKKHSRNVGCLFVALRNTDITDDDIATLGRLIKRPLALCVITDNKTVLGRRLSEFRYPVMQLIQARDLTEATLARAVLDSIKGQITRGNVQYFGNRTS